MSTYGKIRELFEKNGKRSSINRVFWGLVGHGEIHIREIEDNVFVNCYPDRKGYPWGIGATFNKTTGALVDVDVRARDNIYRSPADIEKILTSLVDESYAAHFKPG